MPGGGPAKDFLLGPGRKRHEDIEQPAYGGASFFLDDGLAHVIFCAGVNLLDKGLLVRDQRQIGASQCIHGFDTAIVEDRDGAKTGKIELG